ncbi:MAG: hypothetical protein F2819_05080, partial [Actinobacteria bacterium]|nr:hypothetical protein [Actinomycetota bacterium]
MKKILAGLIAFAIIFASSYSVLAANETVGDSGRIWAVPDDGERGMHVQRFLDA